MPEPSIFGITKPQWDMFNGFANWFGALGSFTAAFIALYIANRSSKPSARATVGHRVLIYPGGEKPNPEYVVFRIVNTGDRPIQVIQIGWKLGLFRKRFAVQICDPSLSSKFPAELSHGQEGSWFIPLTTQEGPWLEYIAREMLLPYPRIALWTIRGQIFSSVGHVFEARLEEGILKRLKAACEKVGKEKTDGASLES